MNDEELHAHLRTLNILSDPKNRPDRSNTELKEATEYVGKWLTKNDKKIGKILPAATIAFSRLYVMAFNALALHAAFTDKKWFAEQVPDSTSEDRAFKNWKSDPKDLTKLSKAVATMILEKKEQSKSADDRNSAASLFSKAAKEDNGDDDDDKSGGGGDGDSSHDEDKEENKKKAKKEKKERKDNKAAKGKKAKRGKEKKDGKKRKKESSDSNSDDASSSSSVAQGSKDEHEKDKGKKRKKEKSNKDAKESGEPKDAKAAAKSQGSNDKKDDAEAAKEEDEAEVDYGALDKKTWEQFGEKLEQDSSLDVVNELLKEIPEPIREKHELPEEATAEDLEMCVESMKAVVAAAVAE